MFQYLEHKVLCFKAGGMREYYNQWQALTSDPEILQMILGQPIEFTRTPYQRVAPREKILDLDEQRVIDTEINTLLAKGVITPSSHEEGEYISPIFTRAKKDGSFRVILNLKCLNTHVQYHHFRMDSLNTVLHMAWVFYGISRPKRCLFFCAYRHCRPKIPEVSVARKTISMCLFSKWIGVLPQEVY